nr:protein phosphatase 2C domain-containing protein [Micromonospora sp. DSM 115978]
MTATDDRPPACPEHGPPAETRHRFCEECGRDLRSGAPATTRLAGSPPTPRQMPGGGVPGGGVGQVLPGSGDVPQWVSSRAAGDECGGCGTGAPGSGEHCAHCGRRRSPGADRAERDLGPVAAVTDRAGRRRNEDAFAVGRSPAATIAVVCDGVATTPRADFAAHAAAEAGADALLAALAAGWSASAATVEAARAAAAAVHRAGDSRPDGSQPSCTYVSAVVTADAVTVGWIGDSRAYWLESGPLTPPALRLTVDDSVAGRLAAGLPVPTGAETEPDSRALVRWLGADAEDTEAQIVVHRPAGPGRLLLCTDGLSHYLPDPADLAAVAAGPGTSPLDLARRLTRIALDSGGHDNVTVAIVPFPPAAVRRGASG